MSSLYNRVCTVLLQVSIKSHEDLSLDDAPADLQEIGFLLLVPLNSKPSFPFLSVDLNVSSNYLLDIPLFHTRFCPVYSRFA